MPCPELKDCPETPSVTLPSLDHRPDYIIIPYSHNIILAGLLTLLVRVYTIACVEFLMSLLFQDGFAEDGILVHDVDWLLFFLLLTGSRHRYNVTSCLFPWKHMCCGLVPTKLSSNSGNEANVVRQQATPTKEAGFHFRCVPTCHVAKAHIRR